jgi:hypothetical protein
MSKTKAMLEQLSRLLKRSPDKQKKAERAQLRALLKELKHRQHKLRSELEHEDDKHRRKHLKREIAVIREQRRKGIKACRKHELC